MSLCVRYRRTHLVFTLLFNTSDRHFYFYKIVVCAIYIFIYSFDSDGSHQNLILLEEGRSTTKQFCTGTVMSLALTFEWKNIHCIMSPCCPNFRFDSRSNAAFKIDGIHCKNAC